MRSPTLAVLLTSLTVAACVATTTPAVDAALGARLDARCDALAGRVGLHVEHVATGSVHTRAADELFPAASLVKVPILVALYERIERGELDPHSELVFEAARSRGGDDLLASFADGARISLGKLIHLMVAFSDNSASLWCQELAGGGVAINDWLERHGYEKTRVNARTPGRESDYEAFGWGQTTPREMCRLLVEIRAGRCVSPRADEEMYRVLCRTYWDSEAVSALPPWVQAATKQGAISRSRSEVVLVEAPSGPYVFCLVTDDQEDRSWGSDNAGFVLLRDVSQILWEHFGADGWSPAPGVEVWR
jgi:beta-lactamase class A